MSDTNRPVDEDVLVDEAVLVNEDFTNPTMINVTEMSQQSILHTYTISQIAIPVAGH